MRVSGRGFGGHPCGRLAAAFRVAIVLAATIAGAGAAAAEDAASPPADRTAAFPDASFAAELEKLGPPANAFSRFFSWDASMTLAATVVRHGRAALRFSTTFQTAGTPNIGTRVSVGGTGYLIRLAYARALTPRLTLAAGAAHLSSHLTRDLDRVTADARAEGFAIPHVADADEYNVIVAELAWRFVNAPLEPEIDVSIEPVTFRFDGGKPADARPVYVLGRWTFWRRGGSSVAAEARGEIGRRPWEETTVLVGLFADRQRDGRFQVFARYSPGRGLHVSANAGAVRDGTSVGIRMAFDSP